MELQQKAETLKRGPAEIKINVVAIFLDAAIQLGDWEGARILRGLLLRRPALPSPQYLNGSTPQQSDRRGA
jgi:hypothetical protein